MYPTICGELAADHFGLGLMLIYTFLTKICTKNDCYIFVFIFVFSDLDLSPLDLIFAPVTLVRIRSFIPISRKSKAWDGRTDREPHNKWTKEITFGLLVQIYRVA